MLYPCGVKEDPSILSTLPTRLQLQRLQLLFLLFSHVGLALVFTYILRGLVHNFLKGQQNPINPSEIADHRIGDHTFCTQ